MKNRKGQKRECVEQQDQDCSRVVDCCDCCGCYCHECCRQEP
jgi:hypothetical protein